jgi:hypothetical protein
MLIQMRAELNKLRATNLKKAAAKTHELFARQRVERNFLRLISVENSPRFKIRLRNP